MGAFASIQVHILLGICLAAGAWGTGLCAQDAMSGEVRPRSVLAESLGASGYRTRVLVVNAAGHPSMSGLATPLAIGGDAGVAFDRPAATRTGSRIAVSVRLEGQPPGGDEAIWADGALAIREGDPISGSVPGESFGPMPTRVDVDESGRLLLGHRSIGAIPAQDDLLLRLDPAAGGVGFATTVLAREGEVAASLLPGSPTDRWRGAFHSPAWLDGGEIAFGVEGLVAGGGGSAEPVLVRGPSIVASGGSVPGSALEPWQQFDRDRFYVAPSTTDWLARGDLTGLVILDDVVAFNGAIVTRENTIPFGSGLPEVVDLGDSMVPSLDPAGRWFVRGDLNPSRTDFILRDNVVVARSRVGDEVVPGTGEAWDDLRFPACFFAVTGNVNGAFVIGGVTDAADDRDGVLMLQDPEGQRVVICREGDPVDLDGNGLFDDNRFVNTFGDDDIVLLDDLSILFVATLRDSSGQSVEEGLFLLEPPSATCVSRNGSGLNPADLVCVEPARLGSDAVFEIPYGPDTVASVVQFASFPFAPWITDFGELLVDVTTGLNATLPESVPGSQTTPARFVIPVPNRLSLFGVPFSLQGFRVEFAAGQVDGQLLNALDLEIGR